MSRGGVRLAMGAARRMLEAVAGNEVRGMRCKRGYAVDDVARVRRATCCAGGGCIAWCSGAFESHVPASDDQREERASVG